jgi:hypothetical protein
MQGQPGLGGTAQAVHLEPNQGRGLSSGMRVKRADKDLGGLLTLNRRVHRHRSTDCADRQQGRPALAHWNMISRSKSGRSPVFAAS